MMGKVLPWLLGVLLLGACDSPVSLTPKSRSVADEELKAQILYEGDTVAYNAFYDKYAGEGTADLCLAYALVMANKYHYAPACYHVYEILTGLYDNLPELPDDQDIAEMKAVIAEIDSAIALVTAEDATLDSAINNIDRGLDYLDPETRRLALSYYGRSLF